MDREDREEKIAMIGEENLEIWPWTGLMTALTALFLGTGGFLLSLGIIFWGSDASAANVFWGGSLLGIMLVVLGITLAVGYLCDKRPNFVVRGFLKFRIIELEPLTGGIVVLGVDGEKHYLKPSIVSYTGEEESYVIFSGRLDNLWIDVRFGKNTREIAIFPDP